MVALIIGIIIAEDIFATVYTELLDNGKPPERLGRKATGLNLLLLRRHGNRAAEGKRLHPPRIHRLS